LALAQGKQFDEHAPDGEMDSPPILFSTDSDLGQSYIEAMTLAGEYAYAGRDVVVDKVLEILGTQATESIHNHHNYAWKETHRGEDVWVIRKGCTPAWPGQQGFVGATMGEPSVILEGIESPAMVDLLYSTVHGAGRVMSRSQAAGKIRRFNVWECNDRRGCAYRAPKGQQLAGGERVPCPDHADRRGNGRRRRV
jgi:tRNA-splicing ligase RtcB